VLLQLLHWKNLHADIYYVPHEEGHVFDKQVECHKRILPELHFDGNAIFDEVRLVIGVNCFLAGGFYQLLLLILGKDHRLTDESGVGCDPIRRPALFPAQFVETGRH
jgi:hypothetical protein